MKYIQNIALFIITVTVGLGIGYFSKGLLANAPADLVIEGNYSGYYQQAQADIIFFATSTCPYCQKTRELLNKNNIHYKEYTLDKSNEGIELYQKLDVETVPVLLIGNKMINGFSKTEILSALQQARSQQSS